MNYSKELSVAINCAHRAGKLQMHALNGENNILRKEDASPVTDVDKACEEMICSTLTDIFPDDGFLGEESGGTNGSSGRRWIVDPLDGTRPYIHGIPTWSTLIALEEESVPVVGVINLPALNMTCWAGRGGGAVLNGAPVRVSRTSVLEEAMGRALGFLEHPDCTLRESLLALMRRWDYAYGFMDAFSYVCMASGRLDCCISLLDKPWDCAAAACIATEAGGKFTDVGGNGSVHNGTTVLSNGVLHPLILEHFSSRLIKQGPP